MENNNYIEGRNAVLEALRANLTIDKLYIATDLKDKLRDFTSLAKEQGVVISAVDRRKLDSMSETKSHQGVIASLANTEYITIDDILKVANDKNEKPFIIVCDGITDPHNLGAIIRSAESAGVHGIIIPKRRSAGINAIVSKSSAGALAHIGICKVTNISTAIDELKDKGVWIFGAEACGETSLYSADFIGSTALVIGSEGDGISKNVLKACDFVVSIPMQGKVNSLNASVASAVLMYEVVRKRGE